MTNFPQLSSRHEDSSVFPSGVAYMDGQYLPMSEAKISILDYGFLRSDATYDVVHVWNGAFFRLNTHVDRFFNSMEKLHMTIPYNKAQVAEILHNCVALSGLKYSYVEFICTRGMSPTFSRDPRDAVNRFIAFAIPFGSIANPEQLEHGLHANIAPIVRISPQSVDPTVKNYHWLDLVNGLYAAYENGADTAILVDTYGNVSEGPGFNVFCVEGERISTPDDGVLLGVTRQTIFDLCAGMNLSCATDTIAPARLRQADEVFFTSTAGGVMPVTKLDGDLVGAGVPGPITTQIKDAYWRMHDDEQYQSPVEYPDT